MLGENFANRFTMFRRENASKKEGRAYTRRNFQRLRRLSIASLHFIVKLNNKTMLKRRQSNLWELKIVFNVRDVSAIFHFATLKLKAQKESFSCENGEKDAQQCRLGAHSTHFMPQWLREYFQLSQQPKMTQTCFCTLHFSSSLRAAIKSMWIIWKNICVVYGEISVVHMNHTLRLKHTTVERFTRHFCLIWARSDTQNIKHQTTDIDPVWKLCSKSYGVKRRCFLECENVNELCDNVNMWRRGDLYLYSTF